MESLYIAAGILALYLLRGSKTVKSIPKPKGSAPNPHAKYRGNRNNNPGNLRISNNQWIGKIPISQNTDGAFEQFTSMHYGVRANLINLRTHYNRGKDTVYKITNTWAPVSDNTQKGIDNYVKTVSLCLGVPPHKVFQWNKQTATKLMWCMFKFENAGETPSLEVIKKSYDAI